MNLLKLWTDHCNALEKARRQIEQLSEQVPATGPGKRGRDALAARGSYVEVRLREGRNRQVRRMLEAVGHPVIALHREAFGPLVLGDLPRGASRPLAEEEVARLKELAS